MKYLKKIINYFKVPDFYEFDRRMKKKFLENQPERSDQIIIAKIPMETIKAFAKAAMGKKDLERKV